MNILSDAVSILGTLGIPIETGVFKGTAPETYLVLIPLSDSFPLSADNMPAADVQELRISLFSKNNYVKIKNKITVTLLKNDFCITERKYNGYDTDAGYHQYTIDIAKNYDITEDL